MIKIVDLSLKYEDKIILENGNIEFERGKIHLITGNSGSGKSSLIKLINGLIPEVVSGTVTGDICYNGKSILNSSITDRSRYISTVFQNPKTQFFTTNTLDELAFAMENRNTPPEEIIKTIDHYTNLLHTEDLMDTEISKLSGGQKQMLAVTAVVCLNQEIYLFDEPSSSLDIESIERIREVCLFLKSQGKIVIIAEHRLYYLKEIADQIIILNNGKCSVHKSEELTDDFVTKNNLRTLTKLGKKDLQSLNYRRKNLLEHDINEGDSLKCIDYCCRYNNCQIFGMSITFPKGIHFIIGENGIGKTSFYKNFCGVLKCRNQKTIYKGDKIKKEGKSISLVMQDVNYQLFTETVWDEISIVSDDDELKEKILRTVGLLDKKDKHPQTLSGGEKQRLSFALCIASTKDIILMDEPTSGLCKKSMGRIISLLKEMERAGKTIIIITHDYEFIMECGGSVIEFYK
ncbi:ATP-binding cassette domain-containing protein [Microaceticoccus formicicus]|uniref:ATP-binding cassette domain-containing protein n=1 Tax=Microaceticoccus formicicus TaxID=3118105 RepID=UPI003CD035A6|nr:ABC transporter ATP-binding protein [Peptoniphilaceae bacterium AMB_02]